ncbi:DUF4440 domain-containing protein [Flavilitoribacter nigricans DSM 23189 = NBRC 102662]|uniref:DUF4440 domain-containing protein n=2 Tax=Flavilitoribacter TaxID=2762562 RepID=A0A2D0NDX6_FLAN2|nr:DUF4440 domain-containing protein [Flavilitoribacter nigricans DSM 23189 = NBRC 102662]
MFIFLAMTKNALLFLSVIAILAGCSSARQMASGPQAEQAIHKLIDQYSLARATKDTALLKQILIPEIDQLVSSGEWRRGIRTAIRGMQRSSTNNPGTRTLTIEQVRFFNRGSAVADARYVIENPDGSARRMWSTFILVLDHKQWKIAAIRNMLPAARD